MTDVLSYESAFSWLASDINAQPHLLLGNGFSMAYDPARFGYSALARRAEDQQIMPGLAMSLMASLNTNDFEAVMRSLSSTAETLSIIDASKHSSLIAQLQAETVRLKEALAESIAGLHPDRPYDISIAQYKSVRDFVDRFGKIYTVNYDLLLYWSLMQHFVGEDRRPVVVDDGFRDSGIAGDETVLWNIYTPQTQKVHYLHGALHLFLGTDGLRKITWIRTDVPLIEQVREQLDADRYPLYVAEGESAQKLHQIQQSAYLSHSLRSLAKISTPVMVYGHSLDDNDAHVLEAVVRSRVPKLAISLYGDPNSPSNQGIVQRASNLQVRRRQRTGAPALTVRFFDAAGVSLWIG